MKPERYVFLGLAIFFWVMAAIYWFMTYEAVGGVSLALSGMLASMVTGYLWLVGNSVGPRPEDREDGEIVEGAGTLGFFPPKSIWPMWCALTIVVIFLGPIFGWWISILGFGMGIWSVSGWVFEFYRGDYAH